ncbi:MAG: hypothetical protein IJQ75_04150 [Synergistaceae bacterium]|nr:hypothetical protein [Synergistaceae bacterium]
MTGRFWFYGKLSLSWLKAQTTAIDHAKNFYYDSGGYVYVRFSKAAHDERDLLGDDIVNLLGDLMQATDETAIDPQDCLIPLAHR